MSDQEEFKRLHSAIGSLWKQIKGNEMQIKGVETTLLRILVSQEKRVKSLEGDVSTLQKQAKAKKAKR